MPATSQHSLVEFYMDTVRFTGVAWDIDAASAPSGHALVPVACELVECVLNLEESINTGGGDHTLEVETNGIIQVFSLIKIPDGTPAGPFVGRPDPRVYLEAGTIVKLYSNGETLTANSFAHLTFVFRKT
jgi:hypothetical protein